MMILSRKTIVVCASLVALVVVAVAFSAPPDRKYKNLKILPKNISDKDMDSVMHSFTRGLGVKCDYCHVPTGDRKMDFASDEKPEKNIARKMMKMSAKINKKYFNYEKDEKGKVIQAVSCYSCHHGDPQPAKNPPPKPQQ